MSYEQTLQVSKLLMGFLSVTQTLTEKLKVLGLKTYLLLPWTSSLMIDFPLWNHSTCVSVEPDMEQLNTPAAPEFTVWCWGVMWAARYEWTFKINSNLSSPYWLDALQIFLRVREIYWSINILRKLTNISLLYPSTSISVINISDKKNCLQWKDSLRWRNRVIRAWVG